MTNNSGAKTPTILTIFGVTGDLSKRKLFPSLLDLYVKGMLADEFKVIGVGRRDWSDKELKEFVSEAIVKKGHNHSSETVNRFIDLFVYVKGDFADHATYEDIKKKTIEIENEFKLCTNKLFYLAVPPDNYETILRPLAELKLTDPCSDGTGWSRILIEKPFGKDLETARALDMLLGELFQEEQVFRIDHYLGKETIQNILAFRFSNFLYESLWDNNHIDRVHIRLHESLGVEGRGSFYDGVGALRDVGQNHMLQMLSFIAMENPGSLNANLIRASREAVIAAITPFTKETLATNTLRGQYDGYLTEDKVSANSQTETYFLLKTFINNDRWQGVPFYLESGKKMEETEIDITVYFKDVEGCLCPKNNHKSHQNMIRFRIQPNESIWIRFWLKEPGFNFNLKPSQLTFAYADSQATATIPDAYERVLYDCICGDQTLFVSNKEVESAWEFITPIIEGWKDLPLLKYNQGTEGPEERSKIMGTDEFIN